MELLYKYITVNKEHDLKLLLLVNYYLYKNKPNNTTSLKRPVSYKRVGVGVLQI